MSGRRAAPRPAHPAPVGPPAALGVAYVLIAAGLAGALVWPVFGTWRVALVTAVGAVGGLGLALLGRRLRWPGWGTALAGLGLYLVVAVPVAVPYRAGSVRDVLRGVVEALAGIVVGWKQLLTLDLPVQEYRATLAPWLAAVLAASLLGTALAVRPDRRAAWAAPVMGLLGALAAAVGPAQAGASLHLGLLTVPDARTTIVGGALVAVTVTWLALRTRIARSRAIAAATATTGGPHRGRRTTAGALGAPVLGVAMALVALAAGLLVAPWAADAADRRSLRAQTDPRQVIAAAPSPLDRYRAAFAPEAAGTELFRVEVSGEAVDRLRIAVLDEYDGQHATTSTDSQRFVREPRSSSSAATSQVTVQIGDGFSGIWLPLPAGALTAPRFTGARADELAATYYVSAAAGAAVVTAGAEAGTAAVVGLTAGDGYTVSAGPSAPATLGAPGSDPLLDADAYPQLVRWVRHQGTTRDALGLTELVERLRARGYLSHWLGEDDATAWLDETGTDLTVVPAYAGHSTARVEALFTDLNDQEAAVGASAGDEALVAAVGDDEQFATAAALLARYLGYESRVVLGVRLASDDDTLTTCDDGACGSDALAAWVEVRSPGGAWVAMDADPQTAAAPRPVTQGQELPQNPTRVQRTDPQVVEPPDAVQDSSSSATPEPPPDPEPEARWMPLLRGIGLGAAALLVVLAPLLTVPIAKAVRRGARRRARVPEVAAVGAWAELSDRCLDLGVPLTGATRREAAEASGRPSATALAVLVDEAVYAPVPPGAPVGDEAWRLIADDLADLGHTYSPWARSVAAMRPRSLIRALSRPWAQAPEPSSTTSKEKP